MAKGLDSAQQGPVRKTSYQAPIVRAKKKEVPDEFKTLKKAKRSYGGCLTLMFVLFIAAAGGYFYWNQKIHKPDKSIAMEVNAASSVISGDQVSYRIKYKNLDTVAMQNIKLSVSWPGGFYFDESSISPTDSNATTWALPDLAAGEESAMDIKGQLVGNKGEKLTATFRINYQPANFNSDFKEEVSFETEISESKLELSIKGADKVMVASDQEYEIIFRNLTTEPISDLYLDVVNPSDFKTGDPQPKKEGQYWSIALEPEEERSIKIRGQFDAESQTEQTLVAAVGSLAAEKFRPLSRVEQKIKVISPKFDVKLSINGQSGDQTVNWGDVLRYQIDLTNSSEMDLPDVKVIALLAGQVLDWDTANTAGQLGTDSITWTGKENSELVTWPKNTSKTFTFEIAVKKSPVSERILENIVKINIEGLDNWEQINPATLVTVGESLTFNNGVYFDLGGRRVGSGLLPPQVGGETQYLVVWSINNATGNFNNITVDTTLPPQVSFVSDMDVPEGEISYDTSTKVLAWRINNFDSKLLPLTASFLIKYLPAESDRGQAATLLNPTTVQAKGMEEVKLRSKLIKTTDVVAETQGPIGIVQ